MKNSEDNGFSRDLSFSNKLRKEGKSNEAFEIMLSALTLEELLALKLECTSRLTAGKLYGFNLWHNIVDITKEALYNAVISIANTNKECSRILGINDESFKVLKRKYKIREAYSEDIE
jgi:hypothetical protein